MQYNVMRQMTLSCQLYMMDVCCERKHKYKN